MMDANATSDEIKSLAINGLFNAVEAKFGKKKTAKAANYVEVKLQSLKDKKKSGLSLDNVLYATPFMIFALSRDGQQVADIAQEFSQVRKDDKSKEDSVGGSQISSSTDDTKSQQNTPSVSSDSHDLISKSPELPSRAVVTPVREPSTLASPVVKSKSFRPPTTAHVDSSADIKDNQPNKEKKDKKYKEKNNPKKEKKVTLAAKGKKEKRVKDPDAPKRATSSYMYFTAAMRSLVLEETPGMSMVDVAKELGSRWKTLSEDDRQVYVDQAAADKTRYEVQMAEYQANAGSKRQLSADLAAAATPPKKKKRVKQVARVSKDDDVASQHGDSSSDECATSSDAQEEVRPIKRRAASDAKKNIRKAVTHSNAPDKAPVVKGTHDEEENTAPAKKRRRQKAVTEPDTNAAVGQQRKMVGIKQADLREEEDLLHSQFIPRTTTPYPAPLSVRAGEQVVLALEPYRTFLAELPADAVDGEARQEIERICSLKQAVVQCVIQNERRLPYTTTPEGDEVTSYYSLLSLTAHKQRFSVLFADFSSPLLTCDTFLVEKSKFDASLRASWLVVNAQVRRLFATDDPKVAEWQEGSVFHIRADAETNPYGAVHVAWMQQERGTDHWLYTYEQTDSMCSPWDLELSSYVLEVNIKPPVVPRALLVGTLSPASVIEFLKTFDASEQFNVDMSACRDPDFLALWPQPRTEDCLDLLAISRLCRQGRYDDESGKGGVGAGVGIATLFADLQRMVAHSKALNASNPQHLPYRLADMLGKAIYRLKVTLAEKRGIASLQRSLEQDKEEEQETSAQAAAVDL